ncbi:MAG: DEAD/DEAH box helicase family protein [Acidobacteria bacterium]|nr:DEAD/DEAH box helicase family protein [Acidobacteriota bacterium]
MPQVLIENPILNSPFEEPRRHFKFDDEGITNEVIEQRRASSYFIPIAQPKKKGKQLQFETEWTRDRLEENRLVNLIRDRVRQWRRGGHVGVTATTARLLEYWTDPEREKKLFFCQIEAVETAIYVAEVARKYGDVWIDHDLRGANDTANPGLPRLALKMATGSGKTVVMAMLIAWQALNKLDDRRDARFSDAFLIVTPGITIRDRLRVLLPTDPDNYYRQRDILPPDLLDRLSQARILVTNYHAFLPREQGDAARLTKAILARGQAGAFVETPHQVVRRVCRDLAGRKHIVVINDEAHHCYRRKPDGEAEVLRGEERTEAEKRDKEARVWLSGLESVRDKIGIRTIYDLSATPFFLKGSGYPEGTLFPWVVSDFSLVDAIESGIVKVPRVPVADNSMTGEQPTYRNLWLRIRDGLPKKGRKTDAVSGEPKLPAELQGALHSLYGNYEQAFARWEQNTEARLRGLTPPVFVVVCSNTNVSKLVFDYVAGWGKALPDGSEMIVPGALPLFSNEDNGRWSARPNTILVDSEQLESGEGMTPEFKKIAAAEIEEFKVEYQQRFPGRSAEDLSDEDLLREVMNTVGKPGKLGEHVRCVVSVSMLTEGWDANTVTHILGVRAFGTQLLCEQVVGRGLRRMSYAVSEDGRFTPEYAEVYGVPFSFIPTSGSTTSARPGALPTRVRALEDRIACEVTFPRLVGYRYEIPSRKLGAVFSDESRLALSTADVPTKTENRPIVGEGSIHTLDDLRKRREAEVAFLLAKLTLEKYFRQDSEPRTERPSAHRFDADVQAWLFPQLLAITKRWLAECVTCKDNTFPQLLLLIEFAHDAADRIYKAIVASDEGTPALRPLLRPYDTIGSTRHVDFDTTKAVYPTDPAKCHVSHVVADTGSWEQKLAQSLEEMPEVACYVKNQGINFSIPYTLNGEDKQFYPDFIARIGDLHLVIEVSGQPRKDKAAKVSTARTLWIPAVNNHGGFGRWAFVEVTDPWDAQRTIRAVAAAAGAAVSANV